MAKSLLEALDLGYLIN